MYNDILISHTPPSSSITLTQSPHMSSSSLIIHRYFHGNRNVIKTLQITGDVLDGVGQSCRSTPNKSNLGRCVVTFRGCRSWFEKKRTATRLYSQKQVSLRCISWSNPLPSSPGLAFLLTVKTTFWKCPFQGTNFCSDLYQIRTQDIKRHKKAN